MAHSPRLAGSSILGATRFHIRRTALPARGCGVTLSAAALRRKSRRLRRCEFALKDLGEIVRAAERSVCEAFDPFELGFEAFQFGRLIGEKILIMRGCVLSKQIAHQAVHQSRHAISYSRDGGARYPETR